jgi:ABC-type multidrug transport system fused ATPase/permease subunit
MVQILSMVGGGIGIAFANGWKLSLVVLCTFPAVAFAGLLQFKFMAGFSAAGRKSQEDAGQIASESISHIRTVASFTGEQALLDKFFFVLQRNKSAGLRVSLSLLHML